MKIEVSKAIQRTVNSKKKREIIREIGIGETRRNSPLACNAEVINVSFADKQGNTADMIPITNPMSLSTPIVFPDFSELKFSCVTSFDVHSCLSIKSDDVSIDVIYPKFIKIFLSDIVSYVTHLLIQ